jgi:hypothetical protein
MSGCPIKTRSASVSLHGDERDGLVLGDLVAREVPGREEHPDAREHPRYDADLEEDAAVFYVPAR